MKVFRSEALLDVVLAMVAVLLLIVLLTEPKQQKPAHYRQADIIITCFMEDDGRWLDRLGLYVSGNNGMPVFVNEFPDDDLFRHLMPVIADKGSYAQIAILFDRLGATCLRPNNVPQALDRLTRAQNRLAMYNLERWNYSLDTIPCENADSCLERLLLTEVNPDG